MTSVQFGVTKSGFLVAKSFVAGLNREIAILEFGSFRGFAAVEK